MEFGGRAEAGADDAIRDAFQSEVLPRLEITRDLFSETIVELDRAVGALQLQGARILEIGAYEGMSSCYFLWRLPGARITCIDTFEASFTTPAVDGHDLERTFDRNVAAVDRSRVRKLVGDSRRVLVDLQEEGARFDLVYVDGSHLGLDVLVDAALAWRLLDMGGILVFDDYGWNDRGDDPLLRPGPAIDAVLALLDGKFNLLERGHKVSIRKLGAAG